MPTENRSGNTEMVSVPRAATELARQALEDDDHFGLADELAKALAQPAPQPHAEPIAWMVGTAFWLTKEEAERDAAATGLPIVGLGPMAGAAPAEQHQGKPAAWVRFRNGEPDYDGDACMIMNVPGDTLGDGDSWQPVYTHPAPADPGEVERLRAALKFYADREHFHFESGNWDTVSGEPLNILWSGDEPDFIEDGTVARAALERQP